MKTNYLSITLLAFIAFSFSAFNQVITGDMSPSIFTHGVVVNYDLDNNGQFDLKVEYDYLLQPTLKFTGLNGTQFETDGSNALLGYNPGISLGNNTYQENGHILLSYFPKDSPKYVGLKFKINGVYHCAYIGVKTNYNGEKFELLNYGYESNGQLCITTPDFTTNLTEQSLKSKTSVFPNPSSDQFTVNLGDDFKNVKISLTTLQGKTVFPIQYSSSSHFNLNMANQAAGVYLLHLESEEEVAVIRLVKN